MFFFKEFFKFLGGNGVHQHTLGIFTLFCAMFCKVLQSGGGSGPHKKHSCGQRLMRREVGDDGAK